MIEQRYRVWDEDDGDEERADSCTAESAQEAAKVFDEVTHSPGDYDARLVRVRDAAGVLTRWEVFPREVTVFDAEARSL